MEVTPDRMCILVYPVNIKTVNLRDLFNRKSTSVRSDSECELKHHKNHMPDEHNEFLNFPISVIIFSEMSKRLTCL